MGIECTYIGFENAEFLAVDCFYSCFYAFRSHNIWVLSHCAKKISVVDQVQNRVRFIKTNTDDVSVSSCFDGISGTSCGAFITSEDTNNTLCNVVLCDTLGFCSITFAVLGFHDLEVCAVKCCAEAFLTVYAGISSCVYINDTDFTRCNTSILKRLLHLFSCCCSSCLIVCGESSFCLYICRGINIYDLNSLIFCFLKCGRNSVWSVCSNHDCIITACYCIVYTLDLLSVIFCIRGHEVNCYTKLFCFFLSAFVQGDPVLVDRVHCDQRNFLIACSLNII